MEKKIISLAEESKISELEQCLSNIDKDELTQLIENRTLKGKGDPAVFISALLRGSSSGDSAAAKRKLIIYKQCITILERNEMNNKTASDLVGLLTLQADTLTGPALTKLASMFIDLVKSGSVQCGKGLEMLPKILSVLSAEETVVVGDNSMSGAEYKNHVLNSLCSCKWDPRSIIHLAAMFKDVTMTPEELKFVVEKVLRMFKDLDLPDLPALVYQLMILSAKGQKKAVLEGITEYFNEQDKLQREKTPNELSEDVFEGGDNSDTLRYTEGTIILHISFAIKQDQELGREFIKFLKSGQQRNAASVLTSFNCALALSIAHIHRFEDQIYDILKSTILRSYKDCEKQENSYWVRDIIPDSCDIETSILETVHDSSFGWDHVIQGLVQLGFILMDSFGPKAAFGRTDGPTTVQSGPTHQACQLGSKMLVNTFKAHSMVRTEILDQIFNRVVTKATSPVSHYLDLLSGTVMSSPQILLESTTKVREMFDYLSFLSPMSADGLLKAIQPLLKFSMSLKDALILVLRKAMFNRQLDSRKIGLNGFLMILKHFRILGGLAPSQSSQTFSSSQIQVDIHTSTSQANNEALCLEIMGNLRRALTQQADVRLLLYQGMYDVLCRNTQLQGPVMDILLNQIKRYYESSEDVNPPIKLELCITAQGDHVYLCEPLAHLICCIQLCLIKITDLQDGQDEVDEDDDDISPSQTQLTEIMESLVRRMIKSEMEDFELDKSADFSLANSVGVKNNIFAILVLGTYEVLMEYRFTVGKLSESSCQEVLQLFENYRKLSDILKEKANAAAAKKGKSSSSNKNPHSLASIRCLSAQLEALISDSDPSHQDSLSLLRENTDFRKYVVTMVIQKLHQIQDKGSCDGAEGTEKSKLLRHICNLGRLFFKHYTENQTCGEEGRKERGKNISGLCLDGLVIVMTILVQRYNEHICKCLSDMVGVTDKEDKQSMVYSHIKRYQRLTMNLITSQEEDRSLKEVSTLLHIISLLCNQLSYDSPEFEKVRDWIQKLCTEQTFDDLSTCKFMFNMLLDLSKKASNSPKILKEIAQDIHCKIGDIDQEVEMEDETNFAMVTNRTAAPTLILLVLSQIEKELDDTEWVINRVKADTMVESGDASPGPTQREGHEKSICTRLGIIVTTFHELVQTAVPIGICSEALVKQITRIYTTLTILVKYFLNLYAMRAGHLTSRFEKLIKLIGTHLTQHCYALITYIQTSENEQLQQNLDKGKKDKKKANAAIQAGTAKVMKASKTIPNLIFSIETFEKFLIQLSKKSKVNLMEHMKLSTSRDFRINAASLQAAMENQSESEESDEEEEEGSDREQNNNDNVSQQQQEEKEEQENKDNSESESDEENKVPSNKRSLPDPDPVEPPSKKGKLGMKGKAKSKSKTN